MENKLITPIEFYEILNKDKHIIGIHKIYKIIKRKDFPAVKLGKNFYIIENKIDEWLNKQSEKFWG